MLTRIRKVGRHRLGMANGYHCVRIPAVAMALEAHRRNWFTTLTSPARHSFPGLRKRVISNATAPWATAPAN